MLFIGSAYSDVCVTACSPWAVCVYRTVWQWDITAGRDPRKAFRVNSNPEVQKDRENVFERLKLTLLSFSRINQQTVNNPTQTPGAHH